MEWNGQKQTNKQSILEAAHRDHEMVIQAFPIWGGSTILGIFEHLKTFISRNRNLLRSAQPIFFLVVFVCYCPLNVQSAGSRLYLINVTYLWK